MYKLLLCWRYLKTRFLAVICIISVMLGVATLIVVNSVMSGFSTKLKDRLHGLLSDVVIETPNFRGFPIPANEMIEMIKDSPANQYIDSMSPSIEVFAMLNFAPPNREPIDRGVSLIGIDIESRCNIGSFREYMVDPARREKPSFNLSPMAQQYYDDQHPRPQQKKPVRPTFKGGLHEVPSLKTKDNLALPGLPPLVRGPINAMPEIQGNDDPLRDLLFQGKLPPEPKMEPIPKLEDLNDLPAFSDVVEENDTPPKVILGWALGTYRDKNRITGEMVDNYMIRPGDAVTLLTVGVGRSNPEPVHSQFIVCDYFRSEMAEYDSHMVFVPLEYLQELRGMRGRANSIQIRLKDYSQAKEAIRELRKIFPEFAGDIRTWEEKQGALIAAIDIERSILNLLLFMIIGVAGFSILAIFSMIVVEKTRDVGILKALGASNRGILMIFVGYGFLLGFIGCLLGTVLGLLFTDNINEIEHLLTQLTGKEVFDRSIYYFNEIPTDVRGSTVFMVNLGASAIAVLFSILPAIRAACLHPVNALRYD